MKYLPLDSATIAKQKSIAAKNLRWPNWYELQMAKHLAKPNVCPHPARYLEDPLHGWVDSEGTINGSVGVCEIEMPDDHTSLYPDDLANIRSERSINAQGPK